MRLAVLLLLTPADALSVGAKTVRTFDVAKLTPADARSLIGERATFRLVLDSLPEEFEGFTLYDFDSPDAVFRSVWLVPGHEVNDEETELIVEAKLRVLHHSRTTGCGGTVFEAFTEYRLTEAVRR